jgi:plasmid stability protein
MEAEARAILTAACRSEEAKQPASSLQELVDKLYGPDKPKGVVESLLEERRQEANRE